MFLQLGVFFLDDFFFFGLFEIRDFDGGSEEVVFMGMCIRNGGYA